MGFPLAALGRAYPEMVRRKPAFCGLSRVGNGF
jgi:hypothetical protein